MKMKTELINTNFKTDFEEDVYNGLTAFPKYVSSKYFYDEKGDKLFQHIMAMPEYYLTKAELNIIKNNIELITEYFTSADGFDIIELGAGDGKKTKVILEYLTENNFKFSYLPIDISQHALNHLEASLKKEIPLLNVKTQQGTYFKVLEKLASLNKRKKVILFLGSSIGNLPHSRAVEFMKEIQKSMYKDDIFFMGFDQKKHPQKILDAYNDKSGITEAFNKNVLTRINSELDADFNTEEFLHWETYDPQTGTAKSFLVSKKKQIVAINKLNLEVSFDKWEAVHTEISQKYDDNTVKWLAVESGLQISESITDEDENFKNYFFTRLA